MRCRAPPKFGAQINWFLKTFSIASRNPLRKSKKANQENSEI